MTPAPRDEELSETQAALALKLLGQRLRRHDPSLVGLQLYFEGPEPSIKFVHRPAPLRGEPGPASHDPWARTLTQALTEYFDRHADVEELHITACYPDTRRRVLRMRPIKVRTHD